MITLRQHENMKEDLKRRGFNRHVIAIWEANDPETRQAVHAELMDFAPATVAACNGLTEAVEAVSKHVPLDPLRRRPDGSPLTQEANE